MTTKQLEALLIDQAFGELSEEASALLEDYLAHSPERRAEAVQVRRAVGLAETAVVARPLDLETAGIPAVPVKAPRYMPFLRLAAAIALLGFALGVGYFAGKGGQESPSRTDAVAGSETKTPSPWARYRVEENGRLAMILPADPNS